MQLLIILALLLYGGKSGAQNVLSEVKPVLESIGGDDMREALKSAEEISTVLSAIKGFAAPPADGTWKPDGTDFGDGAYTTEEKVFSDGDGFPLAPVNKLMDKNIAYSLSRYIQLN